MRRIALTVLLAGVLALTGGEVATASTHGTGNGQFPQVISLPNGFRPEGISAGRGTSFYVGSLVDGAIYRGDVRTGAGSVLIPGQPGRVAAGTKVDKRNRLFVAGAWSGAGHVYDAKSGAELAAYQFAAPGTSFVNDAVVTRDAAYFTDSLNPVLYVVPLGHGGRLGTPRTLPFSGELQYQVGFNANGIEASPEITPLHQPSFVLASLCAATADAVSARLRAWLRPTVRCSCSTPRPCTTGRSMRCPSQ